MELRFAKEVECPFNFAKEMIGAEEAERETANRSQNLANSKEEANRQGDENRCRRYRNDRQGP
jgi:hypothetical protein